jgi:hypothetical protein
MVVGYFNALPRRSPGNGNSKNESYEVRHSRWAVTEPLGYTGSRLIVKKRINP